MKKKEKEEKLIKKNKSILTGQTKYILNKLHKIIQKCLRFLVINT